MRPYCRHLFKTFPCTQSPCVFVPCYEQYENTTHVASMFPLLRKASSKTCTLTLNQV